MRILALETTETIGSVAAFDGGTLLRELRLPSELRSAQSLAPTLAALWKQVGWRPREIALIATTIGPGSFTGLRVGVTSTKTLAYATKAEVLGVGTLDAIAARAPADVEELAVVIDAQRQQLFEARFARSDAGHFTRHGDVRIVDNDAWLAELKAGEIVTGSGLRKLVDALPSGVRALDPELWPPTAAAVGQLAWQAYQAGQRNDLWQLVPCYYRKSAAEEKRGE